MKYKLLTIWRDGVEFSFLIPAHLETFSPNILQDACITLIYNPAPTRAHNPLSHREEKSPFYQRAM